MELRLSSTNIETFEQCPFKWSHKYVHKTPYTVMVNSYLVMGNAFHNLMDHFYKRNARIDEWDVSWLKQNWEKYLNLESKGRINKYAFEQSDLYKLIDGKYIDKNGYILLNQEQLNKDKMLESSIKSKLIDFKMNSQYSPSYWDKKNGYKMISNVSKILKKMNWLKAPKILNNKFASEIFFDFQYLGHSKYKPTIGCKVDLVMDHIDGYVEIIDWKTGRKSTENSLQSIIYSAGFYKRFNIEDDINYLVYPQIDKVQEIQVNDEHYDILREKVNNLLDVFDKGEYEKKVNPYCESCEFTIICDRE